MISLNNISVQFAGTPLFDDISFIINRRDRIGLVGKNGAGKTTLMRIINGQMEPSTGQLASPSGSSIGYLPQEMHFTSTEKVIDEALNAFAEIKELEKRIERLTNELTHRDDYHSDGYHTLSQKLAEANERYDILGGVTQHARAEKVLLGLGFERSDL